MNENRNENSRSVCVSIVVVLVAIAITVPGEIRPSEEKQFFIDMTEAYLPAVVDRSHDADFYDVNLDGYLDLFVSNSGPPDSPNLILINIEGSMFTDETNERLPAGIQRDTIDSDFGDVDNDGGLDVFVGNSNADNQLFIDDGSGYFSDGGTRLPSDSDTDCKDGDFGDVEGDMDLDIIAANFNLQRNLLYVNDGSGYFEIASHSRFPTGGEHSNQNDFGDVDGDFDLDVVIANNTGAANQLLINDGLGYFTDESDTRLPVDLSQSNDIEFGDIDGDGDLDIGVANGLFARCRVLINNGTGYYSDETDLRLPVDSAASGEIDFGDIDNDGDLDIIIANMSSGGLSTRLYINDGNGFFTDETVQRYPSEDDEVGDADFGDVDNDGDLDLIIANLGVYPDGEQNRLLINQSTPDSFPPVIPRTYHHPDTGDTTNPYFITTTVWDNISVVIGELNVTLYYHLADDTAGVISNAEFLEIPMLDCGGFLYRERISAQPSGTIVEYYIKAEDKMGNASYDPPNAPDSVFRFLVDVNVGIGDDPPSSPSVPMNFSLSQNYPNPFNPSTSIKVSIPEGLTGRSSLMILDLRGRHVRSLLDEELRPGKYTVSWDGKTDSGSFVPSGIYLYTLRNSAQSITRKMTVLK